MTGGVLMTGGILKEILRMTEGMLRFIKTLKTLTIPLINRNTSFDRFNLLD